MNDIDRLATEAQDDTRRGTLAILLRTLVGLSRCPPDVASTQSAVVLPNLYVCSLHNAREAQYSLFTPTATDWALPPNRRERLRISSAGKCVHGISLIKNLGILEAIGAVA